MFFVLQGYLDVFIEDEPGKRVEVRPGPWECFSSPASVIHGYTNDSLDPVDLYISITWIPANDVSHQHTFEAIVEVKRLTPKR